MGRDARGRNFGRLRLVSCFGLNLVVSPDIFMWIFPSVITLGLYIGGNMVAGTQPLHRWSTKQQIHDGDFATAGYVDRAVTHLLVLGALFFSLIVGLTDPGALPRVEPLSEHEIAQAGISAAAAAVAVNPGAPAAAAIGDRDANGNDIDSLKETAALTMPHERQHLVDWPDFGHKDPYAEHTHWIECRTCKLRRPPRAAHCYSCQVCTLASDHHCGVVGGCVSIRSLRWFWAYLVCVSSAALNTMTWVLGGLFEKNNHKNPGNVAAHITLLIFIGNIVLMVGGLACFYTYLVLVDTTRRESQGKGKKAGSHGAACEYYHEELTPRLVTLAARPFGHLWRVLFPPPSLIAWTAASSQSV